MHLKKIYGFSLVEMVLFIVVVGLAMGTLLLPLLNTLKRTSTHYYQMTAVQLAQERMALILGQARLNGYTSLADPCPAAGICTLPSGTLGSYTVSAAITPTTINSEANYKLVTVTVSGSGSAELKTLVSN